MSEQTIKGPIPTVDYTKSQAMTNLTQAERDELRAMIGADCPDRPSTEAGEAFYRASRQRAWMALPRLLDALDEVERDRDSWRRVSERLKDEKCEAETAIKLHEATERDHIAEIRMLGQQKREAEKDYQDMRRFQAKFIEADQARRAADKRIAELEQRIIDNSYERQEP